MTDLVVRAKRVWVDRELRAAQVHVTGGLVTAVLPFDAPGPVDVTLPDDQVLLPGLVDSHVHVNEPGRTAWEGFASATRAAAASGVTTIVDMPLNSIPPTTTVEALRLKTDATGGKLTVDVAFWGGAVPGNLGSLKALHDAGVRGFKAFLAPSGVDEFAYLPADLLEPALAEVASIGSVLLVHAEDPSHLHETHGRSYDDFVASRPPVSETEAIAHVIDAMRVTGARAHILHVSAADSLGLIRAARAEGLPLTVETCPHYLTLRAEDVPAGGTQFKCCPPIRDGANQDLLWEAVLDGTFDAIVSDHSPATVDVKSVGDGDFGLSWGGIAGLQLGFTVVWTEARRRGVPLDAILPLFTTGPASVAGLDAGVITVGAPAHLVAFAPAEEWVVDVQSLEHRNPVSPYDGATVVGRARTVWLHGEPVVRNGSVSSPGTGRTVLPEPARA
ncbi:allantoinase AllB [Cellulomonas sp. URHE0023]|uniref:allantoinase AllB n=1 Tax=Cellulomonas sp. URHE0023 TaxID=1380354 RepID=UPI000483C1EB|nr:allantoinase AllB [Cellulomonas sp. URHE0023]